MEQSLPKQYFDMQAPSPSPSPPSGSHSLMALASFDEPVLANEFAISASHDAGPVRVSGPVVSSPNAIDGRELYESNLSMNVGRGQQSYSPSDQNNLGHLSWATVSPTVNAANIHNTPVNHGGHFGFPMPNNNISMATSYPASDQLAISDMSTAPIPMAQVVPPQAFFPAPNFTTPIVFPPPRHACPWHLGCSESFVRVSDLTRHYNSVHLGIKHHCYWVGCKDNGGKGYCRLEKLRTHQRQVHGFALV